MDILEARLCMEQQFCTHCPLRAKCEKRITFYNEKQFFEDLAKIESIAISVLKFLGFPEEEIDSSCTFFLDDMNKKRNKELEEHPIYSPV